MHHHPNHDNRPIGLFDTGVGGILVFKNLKHRFPHEAFECLADSFHFKRADRFEPQRVLEWVRQTSEKLVIERSCKAIVVACNSAFFGGKSFIDTYSRAPVVGPAFPAAQHAVRATRNGRIGIAANAYTARNQFYTRIIKKIDPTVTVIENGCQDWVDCIERSHANPRLWPQWRREATIEQGLQPFREKDCDTIILGCTHFPALSAEIMSAYGRPLELIESTEGIAEEIERWFSGRTILPAIPTKKSPDRYVVTADQERISNLGRAFLNDHSFSPTLEHDWPSISLP